MISEKNTIMYRQNFYSNYCNELGTHNWDSQQVEGIRTSAWINEMHIKTGTFNLPRTKKQNSEGTFQKTDHFVFRCSYHKN